MQFFDFSSLINKYAVDFVLVERGEGSYNDAGDWVLPPPEKRNMRGAIFSNSDAKVYRSDGVITQKDKVVYCNESLGNLNTSYVIYEGNRYRLESNPANNNPFTGVWHYTMKWASAFKDGDVVD